MHDNTEKRYCLNCKSELYGEYCHVCGQHDTKGNSSIKGFLLEYLNVAYMWDAHFLKTFWNLIRRPGYLTNEFVAGKYVSYTHPLKFNMFLLFVFLTIFLMINNTEKMSSSIQFITRDESLRSLMHAKTLSMDVEFVKAMESYPRDTVQLYAPYLLAKQFPQIAINIDVPEPEAAQDSMCVWRAVVSRKLIEDKQIIQKEDGTYYFDVEGNDGEIGLGFFESTWRQMITLSTRFFPILILLTAPLLSLLLQLIYRKSKHTKLKHFIFTLHYISFLEVLILLIYILYLTVSPPHVILEWMMIIISSIYLTISLRNVYDIRNWFKAAGLSLLTNVGYTMILFTFLFLIFIISCIIVAVKL